MKKWKKVMSIVMVIAMAMNSQSVWAASIEDENVSQNQYISTPEEVSNDEKTDDNRLVGNTSGPYTYTIPGTTINLYYTIDGSGNATMSGCDEYAVDIEIPSMINGHKVVCIGGSSFAGRPNLVSVKIPDSVSSIEEDAFFNCSKLMSVNIPDSVTSIGNGAFDSCTSLISIFLPDSVSNLGKFVFSNCSRLGSIDVSESNPDYSSINGILFTKNSGILKICPAGLDVGNYSIPESVNTIEDYAFIQCKKLTAINIPATVKKVGIDAFNGCSGLTTVAIPDSLTAVSNGMFDGCTGLTSVTLPDSITSITARAFCDCSSLASITIPASVSFIGGRAFDGCSSLISIDIPEQVTAIGFGAFEGCTNLSHVTIPNSVTVIENDVFHNCSNLKDITIPVSVTAIRRFAFEGCASLTDIYFSGSKENWNNISIEEYNDNLKSATIHYNTYSIKKNGTYLLRIIDEATSELINNATLTYNGTDYHTDSAGNVQFQVSEASEHTSGTVSISAFPYTTKTADLNSLNPYKCNIINLESSISTPDLNLNLGSTNVDGPKISIYKWKFPLFSLKAEVNIDALHLHVERSIDRSDKTIRYLFGYETDNKDSDNDSYWKTTYANIKDIVNGFGKRTDRQFYNDFRKLRKNLKSQDIKLGVELNGNILGYYESSYAGGKNTFKEGGIVVTAEAALDVQKRIEATADILYAHFRLEGEAQGKYALVLDDTNINDQKLLFEIETKLEFRLKLGIGAGMPAIACAEGGAQGTVTFDIKVYPPKVPALSEAMEIDSKLQLYLKLSLFSIFDKTYNWPSDKDATFELYPEVGWKNSLAGDGLVGSSENADDFTISDYDNYALTPRDYLNAKDSGQDGTSTPLVGASSGLSASYEENNVFPYGSPQVVALSDGRMMAFWIGDNGGSSSANRTQLMCAVRSTDGAWGNAQAVCADGKADFLPCVCADGNKCYVVWRKATETYPEDITVTGMASKLKLVMSIFDGTSFSDLKTVVDDGLYPQFPSLD
ncbi:MAG TPA: leucine-rich repeat domain-containing protein, partial [Lachnospiraceae bacterium]|nr:leucine-rich repeat domain-containing protein [Lachnospiraceae bacterium]